MKVGNDDLSYCSQTIVQIGVCATAIHHIRCSSGHFALVVHELRKAAPPQIVHVIRKDPSMTLGCKNGSNDVLDHAITQSCGRTWK